MGEWPAGVGHDEVVHAPFARLLLAVVCLSAGSPALAADGVIEINQARALAGGVNGSLAADPAG